MNIHEHQAKELLRRYGVYTIHWGSGRTDANPSDSCTPLLRPIRLLIATIQELLRHVAQSKI